MLHDIGELILLTALGDPYAPDELVGQNYMSVVVPRDHEHVQYAFNERRVGERATSNLEVRFKRKPSIPRMGGNSVMTAILSSQGVYESRPSESSETFLGTSGVARDISERKKAEETITFQAFHDLLTKLPNRILFVDRLEMAIAHAKPYFLMASSKASTQGSAVRLFNNLLGKFRVIDGKKIKRGSGSVL
jgi:hypothetical protein